MAVDFVTDFETKAQSIANVVLDDELTISQFVAVARYKAKLTFAPSYVARVQASADRLDQYVAAGEPIYGVNTGLGENVTQQVSAEQLEQLQINTLRSHAVAVGTPLDEESVRAIELMILINLGKGYSGVTYTTLNAIRALLNAGVYQFAPSEGSVGYLSVEAHIFLVLVGEGKAYANGELISGKAALAQYELKPIRLRRKEGLAIIQGTASVTALAIMALYDANALLIMSEVAGAMTFESLCGNTKALDSRIFAAKHHPEATEVAHHLRELLSGSANLATQAPRKLQDSLALRAFPQTIGAVKRVFFETWSSVREEMDSCSDNPIVVDDGVLMCGNFDASYVSLHMDALGVAIGSLVKLIERLTNRLLDPTLSGLPPFLVQQPGVNNGLMIVQYTAAGLLNEIKSLALPVSVDNNTMSAGQEDVVTFGYHAATKTQAIVAKARQIIAIWILTNQAALPFRGVTTLAPPMRHLYQQIEAQVPEITEDRYFYADLTTISKMIKNRALTTE